MADNALTLAGEFDPATDEAWRALVERTLGGREFNKAMTSRTYDDIPLHGLYTQDNAAVQSVPKGSVGEWGMMVPHWNPDVEATNAAILEDLMRGATGMALRLKAGRFPGVPIEALSAALADVHLNMARFTLIPGEEYRAAADAMLALLAERAYDKAAINGDLGVDPVGTLAQTGRLRETAEEACRGAAEIAKAVSEGGWRIQTFMADSGAYHMAGATEAQELGLMMATGVHYLRTMEAAGMDVETAAGQIAFSMAADADMLLTVAKFRAARLLWANVLSASGVAKPGAMQLNGVSSLRMVSVKDPWVNILRSTAACFGAGVGGADNICILPHDSMLGMSSAFARRIARNIQIILQEESGLSRVADPSAGAYAFETITSDLVSKAWEYFQKIESEGGVLAALRGGVVQADLAVAWDKRRANIARRKDAITGVSEFPDIDEAAIGNVGAMPSEPTDLPSVGEEIAPVAFHRLAEDFEKLRAYSDACLEKDGTRPSIFLANIGSAADYTARSTFAKNFFEAGGIKAIVGTGGSDTAEIVGAYQESGAKLAILCSSDGLYEACAPTMASALKKAGAFVYMAGRPSDAEALKEAGVDEFIYMGCDVLELLAGAHLVVGDKA